MSEIITGVRARTIDAAAEYFRERDPQTAVTKTAIRRLLKSGTVPCVTVGTKYLVTIEALEDWLTSAQQTQAPTATKQGIRAIGR